MINDYGQLSDKDFNKISNFIESKYGVRMPDQKKLMVQCRLRKRLEDLSLKTYKEYIDFVFIPGNTEEIQKMVDVLTTHKTDFFREREHFNFISNVILPNLLKNKKKVKFLSAGCSTGEEVYTLVITLLEELSSKSYFNFEVSGFDVSTDSVESAKNGIYPLSKIDNISMDIKKKYFLKNRDPKKKLVKVDPELKKYVKFFTLNLLDDYEIENFDVILCRNTLIYFDRKIQEIVLNKLCKKLNPDGYLIIGHSESIIGMNLPLKQVKPTIFKKN